MNPKVSIIVTCYNLGEFLQEALDSVAEYPHPEHYEVVIVDDGSTDPETVRILDDMDTSKWKVIRQVNMGLGIARNNGIRASRGEYIIPLDADNQLLPALISRTIELLDSDRGIDVVYGDLHRFGEQDFRVTVGPYDFGRLFQSNYIDACAGFRKSLWERLGGYDEQMPIMGFEDWDLWLRASVSGAQFRYVPEVLFNYRVRKESMISNSNSNKPLLVEYIFTKPELRFLYDLRSDHMRLVELEEEVKLEREFPPTGREHLTIALGLFKKRLTKG